MSVGGGFVGFGVDCEVVVGVNVADVVDVGVSVVVRLVEAVVGLGEGIVEVRVGLEGGVVEVGVVGVGLEPGVWFTLEVAGLVGDPPRFRVASEYECQLNYQHALTSLTGIIPVVVGVKYICMGVSWYTSVQSNKT